MRIFYASDSTPNAALASNLWRNNLYLPLVDLGHDVIEFAYNWGDTFKKLDPSIPEHRRFIKTNRPKVSRALLEQLKKAHKTKPIDLFFSYFYDACVFPEVIDEIKNLGIKTVNWYCNGSYQLHLVKAISPHFDWCLVPEKFRLKDYEAMGAHPIYCQEAANPNIYKSYKVPREYAVTFVGQAYGERPAYIKYLLDQGIDIKVWGFGWQSYKPGLSATTMVNPIQRAWQIAKVLPTRAGMREVYRCLSSLRPPRSVSQQSLLPQPSTLPVEILGGSLSDVEMIQMYSRSKINLGFSTCGNTHLEKERIMQVRLRDFEVPMSGGFYMVEYMEELEEFFEIGKEVVCYQGAQDLAEKIKYYLGHDAEREKIRLAGHKRAMQDHTWHKRFEAVFKQMGLGQ